MHRRNFGTVDAPRQPLGMRLHAAGLRRAARLRLELLQSRSDVPADAAIPVPRKSDDPAVQRVPRREDQALDANRPSTEESGPPHRAGAHFLCGSAPDLSEMRVGERRGVFEPVAEHSIERDVRRPNQRDSQAHSDIVGDSDESEQNGTDVAVDGVIAESPNTRALQIPEHRDIGGKKQHREKKPREAAVPIQYKDEAKRDQSFRAEEILWAAAHTRSIVHLSRPQASS